jgi:hypothetical protein
MNSFEREAKRAAKHIRQLARGIGPRPATTEGERRAAAFVCGELERIGASRVTLHRFQGSISGWVPWAVPFSLVVWGYLLALLLAVPGAVIAAVLDAVATVVAYRQLVPGMDPDDPLSLRRWLWRGESQNVHAILPPAGAVDRRVVLLAYLDSPITSFFWATGRRRRLVQLSQPLLFLSLPASGVALLLGALGGNVLFYFAATLLLPAQAVALLACVRAGRRGHSAGANNNASGVGSLLALAERLKQSPLASTEVWVLATGCRETGGDGARAFLARHRQALSEAAFVALEGLGVGERVIYLCGEGSLFRTAYSQQLRTLAERAAERCRQEGLNVSAARHPDGPTEIGLICRTGLNGLGVNCWPDGSPGVARWRQVEDRVDFIDEESLSQAHRFIWALLQEIDSNPTGGTERA